MPYTEAEEHWLNHQYRLFDEAFLSVSIGEEILQVKWSILMYCSVSNLEIIYFKIVCVCLCLYSYTVSFLSGILHVLSGRSTVQAVFLSLLLSSAGENEKYLQEKSR